MKYHSIKRKDKGHGITSSNPTTKFLKKRKDLISVIFDTAIKVSKV